MCCVLPDIIHISLPIIWIICFILIHSLAPVVYTSEAASSVRLWAGEPLHMIRASRTLWGKKVMMLGKDHKSFKSAGFKERKY